MTARITRNERRYPAPSVTSVQSSAPPRRSHRVHQRLHRRRARQEDPGIAPNVLRGREQGSTDEGRAFFVRQGFEQVERIVAALVPGSYLTLTSSLPGDHGRM